MTKFNNQEKWKWDHGEVTSVDLWFIFGEIRPQHSLCWYINGERKTISLSELPQRLLQC